MGLFRWVGRSTNPTIEVHQVPTKAQTHLPWALLLVPVELELHESLTLLVLIVDTGHLSESTTARAPTGMCESVTGHQGFSKV